MKNWNHFQPDDPGTKKKDEHLSARSITLSFCLRPLEKKRKKRIEKPEKLDLDVTPAKPDFQAVSCLLSDKKSFFYFLDSVIPNVGESIHIKVTRRQKDFQSKSTPKIGWILTEFWLNLTGFKMNFDWILAEL